MRLERIIEFDWFGDKLARPFWGRFEVKDELALFRAVVPYAPPVARLHSQGDFIEGLWNSDVVELFIGDRQGRYVEFNVSADGAWWFMPFADYRIRAQDGCDSPQVDVSIVRDDSQWQVRLSFQISSLLTFLSGIDQSHFSAIHYQEGVPVYISSRAGRGGEPDFHLSSCFCSLCVP